MTLFWHNYFATGYSKVPPAIKSENGTRLMAAKASEDPAEAAGADRTAARQRARQLPRSARRVAKDPAMLIWLDGDTNTKAKPQENFGRELMELFSRGVGFYTEDDVYAAARVFTGLEPEASGRPAGPDDGVQLRLQREPARDGGQDLQLSDLRDGGQTIPTRAASAGMQDGLDLITALSTHPETARRLVDEAVRVLRQRDGRARSGASSTSSRPSICRTARRSSRCCSGCSRRRSSRIRRSSSRATRGRRSSSSARSRKPAGPDSRSAAR